MTKKAISVTLRPENLLWLVGQTRASSRRSVSETLDELIARARAGGSGRPDVITSVVGTVTILPSDPGLMQADAVVRRLFPRPGTAGRPRSRGAARLRVRRA